METFDPTGLFVEVGPWVEAYVPDEIFQATEELEAGPEFWDELPGPDDLDLFTVTAFGPTIQHLQVKDADDNLLVTARDNQLKNVNLTGDPAASYSVASTAMKGVGEPRFLVRRDACLFKSELTLDSPVASIAFAGNALVVANGNQVDVFDVYDLQNPTRSGSLVFESPVEDLSTHVSNGRLVFAAAGSNAVRTFCVSHAAESPVRILDEQQRTVSADDVEYEGATDAKLLAADALSELRTLWAGDRAPTATRISQTAVSDRWIVAADGNRISIFKRGEAGQFVSQLTDVPACVDLELKGNRLIVYADNGETLEFSLRDPGHPEEITRYVSACAHRQLLLKGRKGFRVMPGANRVRLYWRTARPLDRDFVVAESKRRWQEAMSSAAFLVGARPDERRYVANRRTQEVHDLGHETSQCRIDEIVEGGNAVAFEKDSLARAHWEGYDNCAYCLGRSIR